MARDGEADATFGPERGLVQRTRRSGGRPARARGPRPGARRGSVLWGLAQTLALFVTGGVLLPAFTELDRSSDWYVPMLLAAFATSLALGAWHQARRRPRTAAGAFAGALAWPATGCTLALWVVWSVLAGWDLPY